MLCLNQFSMNIHSNKQTFSNIVLFEMKRYFEIHMKLNKDNMLKIEFYYKKNIYH